MNWEQACGNAPEIVELYLQYSDLVTGWPPDFSGKLISAIEMGEEWIPVHFVECKLTQKTKAQNGFRYFEVGLSFEHPKAQPAVQGQIHLNVNRALIGMVVDNNDQAWIAGSPDQPLRFGSNGVVIDRSNNKNTIALTCLNRMGILGLDL